MMRLCVPVVIVTAVLVLGQAPLAHAQRASFTNLRDAVPRKYFDATTSVSSITPNVLVIGLDSGFDSTSLTSNSFAVSNLTFANRVASDTIAFTITAPTGFYVSKIVYQQKGTGSTLRGAVERGTAHWVVAGFPSRLGEFTSNPNLSGTAVLTRTQGRSFAVSITDSLFAGPNGSLEITDARVIVTLSPL